MTDQSGKIVWSARYAAFGRAYVSPNSTYSNNIRFQGQYEDRETGLHYNYHRYYNPERGRYLSKDPIGLSGGVNLRGYSMGAVTAYADPLGLVYKCTQPLHSLPSLDNGGKNLFHHAFLVTQDGIHAGGQDRAGNPFLGEGRPSEHDDFATALAAGRCDQLSTDPCVEECVKQAINGPRPQYTVIPLRWLTGDSNVEKITNGETGGPQNCQDWVDNNYQACLNKCK